MDDTQQQPVNPQAADAVSTMNDVASLTPPPAPVVPSTNVDPMQTQPSTDPVVQQSTQPMENSVSAMPVEPSIDANKEAGDDYSYAEDILNEILDSLDRIEAKLDAMEKKMG